MSEPESFLRRWSRRKQERSASLREPLNRTGGDSAKPVEGPSTPELSPAPATLMGGGAVPAARPLPDDNGEPHSELPPIESIEQCTDIRGFLAEHVPEDLARAALRRAWAQDPAIRNFVGLSENSWDFTAAGGVPGFGACAPAAAGRLLAQVLGPNPGPRQAQESKAGQSDSEVMEPGEKTPLETPVGDSAAEVNSSAELRDAAAQQPGSTGRESTG